MSGVAAGTGSLDGHTLSPTGSRESWESGVGSNASKPTFNDSTLPRAGLWFLSHTQQHHPLGTKFSNTWGVLSLKTLHRVWLRRLKLAFHPPNTLWEWITSHFLLKLIVLGNVYGTFPFHLVMLRDFCGLSLVLLSLSSFILRHTGNNNIINNKN